MWRPICDLFDRLLEEEYREELIKKKFNSLKEQIEALQKENEELKQKLEEEQRYSKSLEERIVATHLNRMLMK